jgi:toxin ParE1/3/4
MRLEWSRLAQADRDAIFDYIEADSPQAAITVDDRIRVQVDGLVRFPEGGRPGRFEGTREVVILRTPYIAAYRVAWRHRANFARVARCPAVARGRFRRTAKGTLKSGVCARPHIRKKRECVGHPARCGYGIRRIQVTRQYKCAPSWDGARCCFACSGSRSKSSFRALHKS